MALKAIDGVVPDITVADRMRKAREYVNLDQSTLADEIGISRQSISNYETGATRPRRIVLKAMALRTGVSLTWLETGMVPTGPTTGQGGERPQQDSNLQPTD